MATRHLSPGDMEVLEFERTCWRHQAAKDAAILERFRHLPFRYYQRLAHILTLPAAEVYDPVLVRRLRRLRDTRRSHRYTPEAAS